MELSKTKRKLIRPKDIYVIRPMKLVKSVEHTNLMFPYNLLANLHLIEKDEYLAAMLRDYLQVHDTINPLKHLKSRIQNSVPEHLYDAATIEKTYTFEALNSDITLGVEEGPRTIYADLFTGRPYFSDSIRCAHPSVEPGEEFIFIEYINSIVDELHQQMIKNGYDFIDEIEYLEHLILQNHQLQDKEALKTLREILNKIQESEDSKEITVFREETKQFADKHHFFAYSVDINGHEFTAKPKIKIYEKKI